MLNVTPMVRNLLIINVALFLLQVSGILGGVGRLLALYSWPSEYFYFFQHLTHMFMHADIGHLFSNMFGLFSFGPMLEMRWGPQRFLMFWLVCGVGAGILYNGVRQYEVNRMETARNAFVENPTGVGYQDFFRDNYPQANGYRLVATALQKDPNNTQLVQGAVRTIDAIYEQARNIPMVGASGALFGILLAFAYLFPNTELMIIFVPIPIKAKYFVTLYGLYTLYAGIRNSPDDNVAHFAHLGGLVIGFLLLKYWERGRSRFY